MYQYSPILFQTLYTDIKLITPFSHVTNKSLLIMLIIRRNQTGMSVTLLGQVIRRYVSCGNRDRFTSSWGLEYSCNIGRVSDPRNSLERETHARRDLPDLHGTWYGEYQTMDFWFSVQLNVRGEVWSTCVVICNDLILVLLVSFLKTNFICSYPLTSPEPRYRHYFRTIHL